MRGNTHPIDLPHAVMRRLPVDRAALIVAWTPFAMVLAHMAVFDILPLGLAAATLAIALSVEIGCVLRRRAARTG